MLFLEYPAQHPEAAPELDEGNARPELDRPELARPELDRPEFIERVERVAVPPAMTDTPGD